MRESDQDESDDVFQGCGPAQCLTVGFSTATFGGTITGFDFTTHEEKTVTVNAKLIATGKAETGETSKFSTPINNRDINEVVHASGTFRPASGSLDIGGGITFSFDDARGIISKLTSGTIQVTKN